MNLIDAPETIELFAQAGIGEVEQTITCRRRGRVGFAGSYWFARFYNPSEQGEALPGTAVRVMGREGQTLLVVPVSEDWIPAQRTVVGVGEERSGFWGFLRQIGLALW